MKRPRICAVITGNDPDMIKSVEPLVELFEVRIDIIGKGWRELVSSLNKPWIACNRRAEEGGNWHNDETARINELLEATKLGASIIDIELESANLEEALHEFRKKAEWLISFHDLKGTPPLDRMRKIVEKQLEAGADLCKVVTTARSFEDNLTVLQLISSFPATRVISFAMGPLGSTSRILCPLVGGDFTYASISTGKESAPGQITVQNLCKIYGILENERHTGIREN
jgi:3-dehydroquinate dehydratase type I